MKILSFINDFLLQLVDGERYAGDSGLQLNLVVE